MPEEVAKPLEPEPRVKVNVPKSEPKGAETCEECESALDKLAMLDKHYKSKGSGFYAKRFRQTHAHALNFLQHRKAEPVGHPHAPFDVDVACQTNPGWILLVEGHHLRLRGSSIEDGIRWEEWAKVKEDQGSVKFYRARLQCQIRVSLVVVILLQILQGCLCQVNNLLVTVTKLELHGSLWPCCFGILATGREERTGQFPHS